MSSENSWNSEFLFWKPILSVL